MKTTKNHSLLFIGLLLLFFSCIALADTPGAGVLDAINTGYSKLQKPWFDKVQHYAFYLFWILVRIDFAWSAICWVRDRKEFGEIIASITQKIFTLTFFFIVLKMAYTFVPAILQGFIQVGQAAGGSATENLTPDGIVIIGLKIALTLFQQLLELNIAEIMFMVMIITPIAIVVAIAYAVVACQLLITLIESYIVVGAGVIMLGFSGSKWTVDMATSYLKYAVGTGIKLMILFMVIGAGMTLFTETNLTSLSGNGNPFDLIKAGLIVLIESLIFGVLCWQIPSMASAMTTGSPSLTLGSAVSTGAALVGAQMVQNMAKQTLEGGKSLGSKGANLMRDIPNLGSFGGGNSINQSQMPSSAIPDPFGPLPNSVGNATTASIGNNKISAETQAKLDKAFPKNKDQSSSIKLKPINDQANIQVSGINLNPTKD